MDVPGKIFILGEYSVLRGQPAIIATVKADRLPGLYGFGSSLYGFGSSTARIVLANSLLSSPLTTQQLWLQYRNQYPMGSGADLIAQDRAHRYQERIQCVRINPLDFYSCDEQILSVIKSKIHVFSAVGQKNRKLRTDHALFDAKAVMDQIPDSSAYVEKFLQAKTVSDLSCLEDFSEMLIALGLETSAAKSDRLFMKQHPDVAFVKGCGGGLNDAFLVVLKDGASNRSLVVLNELSHALSLQYLGTLQGLTS